MLNLDTHVFLHALAGDLSASETKALKQNRWSISDIVLWEITMLSIKGRLQLNIESSEFMRLVSQVHVWPISLEVCRHLSHLDFKSDPADEIIAATSLAYDLPLVTRDKRIRKSKLIRFI